MKRILVIVFMLMLVPICALVAEDLVIKITNGTVLRIPVETIESITFSSVPTTPTTPTIPTVPTVPTVPTIPTTPTTPTVPTTPILPSDPLVGQWTGSENDTGLGFEFKVNGDFIYSKNGVDISGTWRKTGNKLSMLIGGKEEVFTYYVQNDNLTLLNSSGITIKMVRIVTQTPNPPTYPGAASGLVFYDKGYYSEGWRYLEAAPASSEWSEILWGAPGVQIGGTGLKIGDGELNTQKIISKLGVSGSSAVGTRYAAKLCADYTYRGTDDWYLPSKGELDLMYQQRTSIGGFSTTGNYWSSSEEKSLTAWAQSFSTQNQSALMKNSPLRVRAVRAF